MEEGNGEQIMNEGEGLAKPKQLSAAQKKREKLRLKKKLAKDAAETEEGGAGDPQEEETRAGGDMEEEGAVADTVKEKRGGDGGKVKAAKGKNKGPSKAHIAAILAHRQAVQEEEERLLREEEEIERKREEAEQARLEKLREEQEKIERKKQAKKLRLARLKEEGKLLTPRQKQDRQRAQQLLESLKAQGAPIPDDVGSGEKKKAPRLGTRLRGNKKNLQQKLLEEQGGGNADNSMLESQLKALTMEAEVEKKIKEAWDESEGEENPQEETPEDDETSEGDDSTLSSDVVVAEDPKPQNVLRSPVVCVLGHVDTGKTKLLDKLRRTAVQDGEAGGITQQIGATNVPIDSIKECSKWVKNFSNFDVTIPGLLLIDTPGHESFSNLRSRGSSLCDIAILVVDIMHGLEPQTIESIKLLKRRETPFVVALNKIDRIYDWHSNAKRDVRDVVKSQSTISSQEFQKLVNQIIVQFAEEEVNVALCYDNPDPSVFISMVPTSAFTGEGMGNLMALIVEHSQTRLETRLRYSDELEATVMEVKAISGLGTTIDVILVNGGLREGDTLVLAGTDGPIVTQIRALLTPQPMKELRVKNTYIEYKEIRGAVGVKVCAKDLETAIAGLNVHVAYHPDDVERCKEMVQQELKTALSSFHLLERGVYVQASTLGSLEALLEFLRTSSIPYSGIRIGPVVRKDVNKASIMLEHDNQYAVILAFDVKIEKDAQDLANSLGVKIFQADIIYHLFDKFTAYREELATKKREALKHLAVFPCKLKILPQFIFNSRDPIVVGVNVEAGTLKHGTPICVPAKEFLEIGRVSSIEINHKQVERATKGQEVCIKIDPIPGESPKLLGRHFEVEDELVSKITRESIDACKECFRNDLQKADWQLMLELKKLLQII